MKKAVFSLVATHDQANRLVDHIVSAGFGRADISVLYPERKQEMSQGDLRDPSLECVGTKGSLTTEMHSKAPEGATTGALAGGLIGGSLGLLAGIGALAIPGFGAFVAAGPLMAALIGSGIGGGIGLFIGALAGWGIPEYEAKKLEAGVQPGQTLVSVHTESGEEADRAKDIFKQEGAKDISCTCEKTTT